MQRPVRPRWLSGVAALLGLAVLGGIATYLSAERAVDTARAADERAVALVTDRINTGLTTAIASLSGADTMAADGAVTEDEFGAFGADIVPNSDFTALAFAELVDEKDRADWEATTGVTMTDRDSTGNFVPAAARDRHVVVRYVAPANEQALRVVGFDFLGDPTRTRGVADALDADEPSLVGPIRLATSDTPGVFVSKAVRRPDGTVVGLISSGLSLDRPIVDRLEQLPQVEPATVTIDGEPLVTPAGGSRAAHADFTFAGRTFDVWTGDRSGVSWLQPLVIALGTLALCIAAWLVGRRGLRDAQRQQRLVARGEQLTKLAEALVSTNSTRAVMRVASAYGAPVLGAAQTHVARRVASDPDVMEVVRSGPEPEEPPSGVERIALATPSPLTDSARDNRTVFVPAVTGASRGAVLAVPLSLGTDTPAGSIAFAWTDDIRPEEREELETGAQLAAQMVGRAYERALVREVVQQRVQLLSEFAGALAAAHSLEEIDAIVDATLPALLEVGSASLAAQRVVASDQVLVYPPLSQEGMYLVLRRSPSTVWNPTLDGLTRAVVELLEGATARARRSEHEHSVLQRLQDSLLTPAPEVPGFEIAVAYRSAIEAVGIGGDWYSVVDSEHALHAVIGDVAGHGPGAVAIMAQVKTVIRHLLSVGAPIDVALEHASTLLESRDAYASAAIVRIDKRDGSLTYVNAGHPYPLVCHDSETIELRDVHRPWLGLPSSCDSPSPAAFPAGATLVMYTDGLVEERRIAVDRSIDELADRIADDCPPPGDLVDVLLAARHGGRTAATVDDDIAIVAIRRDG